MQIDSLVIFKSKPARVVANLDKKVEIALSDDKRVKLPEKNLLLLHSGGFESFDCLEVALGDGELKDAWEVLQGQSTSVAELSELIYGEFTPKTAYATWQQVSQGVYFSFKDDEIEVNSEQAVAEILQQAKEKAQKAKALEDFIERLKQKTYSDEDSAFVKEIESFAMGRSSNCRFFKLFDREESVHNAHAILLDIGYWDIYTNPYPSRLGAPDSDPVIEVPKANSEIRKDLTHLLSLAIDDEGSNDPDDAISFDEENAKVWVHVADPAAVVSPESALDIEARSRGSNLYLPEGIVPILPFEVTHDFALGLQECSPALSIGFKISDEGEIDNIEICLSTIKVKRLSYKAADSLLPEVPLNRFDALSRSFTQYRRKKGAVELQFPEVKLHLQVNNGGAEKQVRIHALESLRSRNIIKDAMLMAGVAVAKFADQHNIPLPFSTQSAHDLAVEEQTPKTLSQMFATRRRLQKGQYKSAADNHSGMGLPAYVQVTSPLRRYLDLVVHQQLRKFIKGQVLFTADEILQRIAQCEAGIKAARQSESFSNNHWKCVYLIQNEDWQGEAIVIEKQINNRVTIFIPALSLIKKMTLSQSVELDEVIAIKLSQVKLASQDIYFSAVL